ncbi:transcriptional regulator containing an amidase domain and an AraC-type DNA-binding HTH domain [Spongiibacter sp. IMCC21906]|jgi:transcriptional regulator GlxA family with amidase domain|uniref:GlxA family transcriptional regulator n=1 Tax=Spongiibacter sp. IMCC21906 TaxID=1620392 RepID=UPI00062DF2D0|nr:helix-turn-helix domain-containing protein [Spongiibacter sp. IMCC21906]AKH70185.1 transcriptional regulator containing an amidase domain and an AraC-type DNA-binding HTH domain [Spongiibacter sp. IMCC21906]
MKKISLLAFQDALATSISLPMELFNAVNSVSRLMSRRDSLSIELIGLEPGLLELSGGLKVSPTRLFDPDQHYDIVIISSRWRHPHLGSPTDPKVKAWLKSLADAGSDICAVGNGSYFLGEAGLLDGRAATTHWHYFDDFAKRYPKAQLKRDYLITQAENIYCTGSVNAAADLIIHLIDRNWGALTARRVAQQFSPESRRPFSRNTYRVDRSDLHGDETIALLQEWLVRNMSKNLRLNDLSEQSGLSERSLLRRFRKATGQSPLSYLQRLRMDLAEDLLKNSNLSIEEIGQQCGYQDRSYFGKLFKDHASAQPGAYRRAVRRKLFAVKNAPEKETR